MCGIGGIVYPFQSSYSGTHRGETEQSLQRMARAMAHRGPDGEGFWLQPGGQVGLCHRRLAIIDLSPAAAQPMAFPRSGNTRYQIVYNGEIYNHPELREQLRKEGYSFHTQSDTEVILAAFDHYGDECVDHFDGMFAFAIWDEEAGELFAARDRFGEKPFYYSLHDGVFTFASEMKALWEAGVRRQANLQLLFNFITIGYTDNPGRPEETFFQNVQRLPAGSVLRYYSGTKELEVDKYYDPDPSFQRNDIGDEEALETFDQLLRQSVRYRLRSDVAVGCSLSGGLDSSSILSLASAGRSNDPESPGLNRHPLKAFTAVFPGYERDESGFAEQAARNMGIDWYPVRISVDELVRDWDRFAASQEEPFGSASAYAQYRVYEAARHEQISVLLDGQGADETLAGYPRYYKWYWQELFQKRRLVRSGELKAARRLGVEERFGWKNIVAALAPDIASVLLERQYLLAALRHPDLHRDFVRAQSHEAYYSAPALFNLNGVLHFNTCIHGLEELLRLADRNSMAHGREVRLPFLSHTLVEFIFSLPAHFKIRQGWTKWLLRKTMDKRLPDPITWRKDKVGFEPPQQAWMKDTRMVEMVRAAREKLVGEKILRPDVVDRPVQAQPANAAEGYDWRYLTAAAYL